ncbi:hypothetical protein [Paenibacillus sp. YYML68]|uniref:hypothetical protein n=1 Tax=Paenibacillus sp. YYML68 TaxID=2909250 RepID=UPI002490025D|nr:hypothetical protein [Paenibacillus sp. YYML68]
MKIALHNELPGEAQYKQWLEAMKVEAAAELAFDYETLSRCERVVAAYDDERLVGIGRSSEHTGAERSAACKVLPAYERREIERYMQKLLK